MPSSRATTSGRRRGKTSSSSTAWCSTTLPRSRPTWACTTPCRAGSSGTTWTRSELGRRSCRSLGREGEAGVPGGKESRLCWPGRGRGGAPKLRTPQEFVAQRIEQRRAKGYDNTVVDTVFWCRSGHHRSVGMVEMLASVMEEARALARSLLRFTCEPNCYVCLFALLALFALPFCSLVFAVLAPLLVLCALSRFVLLCCLCLLACLCTCALACSLALLLDCLLVRLRACLLRLLALACASMRVCTHARLLAGVLACLRALRAWRLVIVCKGEQGMHAGRRWF